jgi:hypothetical protein
VMVEGQGGERFAGETVTSLPSSTTLTNFPSSPFAPPHYPIFHTRHRDPDRCCELFCARQDEFRRSRSDQSSLSYPGGRSQARPRWQPFPSTGRQRASAGGTLPAS